MVVGATKICQATNTLPASQFQIEVRDPCLDDSIISSGWDYPMEARQLAQDSVSLITAIGEAGGVWPWYSETEDRVKFDVCGRIVYEITYANGSPQNMVTLSADSILSFSP